MTADDLRNHIGVTNIHLHHFEKEGVGYLGFELGCSWDDEYGLGVMLHGSTVVDIGGADTSILGWIAQRHKDGVASD